MDLVEAHEFLAEDLPRLSVERRDRAFRTLTKFEFVQVIPRAQKILV